MDVPKGVLERARWYIHDVRGLGSARLRARPARGASRERHRKAHPAPNAPPASPATRTPAGRGPATTPAGRGPVGAPAGRGPATTPAGRGPATTPAGRGHAGARTRSAPRTRSPRGPAVPAVRP